MLSQHAVLAERVLLQVVLVSFAIATWTCDDTMQYCQGLSWLRVLLLACVIVCFTQALLTVAYCAFVPSGRSMLTLLMAAAHEASSFAEKVPKVVPTSCVPTALI